MDLTFNPMSTAPNHPRTCVIKRNLNIPINSQGLTERREEFIISDWTGKNWLNKEAHWEGWLPIPNEAVWSKVCPVQSIPPVDKPVILCLKNDVRFNTSTDTIIAGFKFGIRNEDEWKVHFNSRGLRSLFREGNDNLTLNGWIHVPDSQVTGWLDFGLKLDYRIRAI